MKTPQEIRQMIWDTMVYGTDEEDLEKETEILAQLSEEEVIAYNLYMKGGIKDD